MNILIRRRPRCSNTPWSSDPCVDPRSASSMLRRTALPTLSRKGKRSARQRVRATHAMAPVAEIKASAMLDSRLC